MSVSFPLKSRYLLPLLACLGMVPCVPALAEPVPDLRACAALEDSVARLACYDALAAEQEMPELEAASQELEAAPESLPEMTESAESAEAPTAMELRVQQSRIVRRNWFAMTPYRPNYLLPMAYNHRPNEDPVHQIGRDADVDRMEVKFQFSLEFDVWRQMLGQDMDLYFAYTQQAWWQMYNSGESSPFREVNYEPEMGVTLRPDIHFLGMNLRQLRVGLVHHSNGRGEPLSRSWNRTFATAILDRGNFATALRVWHRLPESAEEDDNPDITDYYGNFEWYAFYKWRRSTFGFMVRNNLDRDDNRGALQLDWSYPLSDRLKFYMQYFNGYGESLIDYNHSTNRFGIGLMLTDWL